MSFIKNTEVSISAGPGSISVQVKPPSMVFSMVPRLPQLYPISSEEKNTDLKFVGIPKKNLLLQVLPPSVDLSIMPWPPPKSPPTAIIRLSLIALMSP